METKSNPGIPISLLFVEDDEIILAIQASILTARFPDVTLYTAVNGRLGLELFKAHRPDIVITDINMPEMCGVQMSENIRAIKPDTKLIAITGKSGRLVLQHSDEKEFEFDHRIVKPVVFQYLFDAIEQCVSMIAQKT